MTGRWLSRLSLYRPEEHLVLGPGKLIDFKASTDSAFGGTSKASFVDNRFFRGELVGENHFAAVRAILPRQSSDIGDFEKLALRVKSTEKRNFSINLQTPSFFLHDLYQGFIVLPEQNKFFELSIPFASLLLTAKGRVREDQRRLDTYELSTIGFSVGGPGSKPGKFELEVDWIKWVQ